MKTGSPPLTRGQLNVYESLGKNGVIKSEREIFLELPINVGGRHVS